MCVDGYDEASVQEAVADPLKEEVSYIFGNRAGFFGDARVTYRVKTEAKAQFDANFFRTSQCKQELFFLLCADSTEGTYCQHALYAKRRPVSALIPSLCWRSVFLFLRAR